MNKSAVYFALSSLFVSGFCATAMAADDGLGYGAERPYSSSGTEERPWRSMGPMGPMGPMMMMPYGGEGREKPLYYKPTMRFYGNGYTVNYRYVPVYQENVYESVVMGATSNFRTDPFRLTPEQVATWGANAPRITVKDNSSSGPRTAVTSIVHKKTTTKSTRAGKVKAMEPTDGAPPVVLPSTPSDAPQTAAPATETSTPAKR